MKKIIMTGGGTSGHVTPNIALFKSIQKQNYEIYYVGSAKGIEKNLIEKEGIPFYQINSGKLRRYLDLKNLIDAFKVIKGFGDALLLLRKLKPNLVFSKGGFVTAPVVWAAYLCRVPIVIHESDFTPGLSNKLSAPFATKICYTFPETKKYLSNNKSVLTGIPVREILSQGNKKKGLDLCSFDENKPVIMVIGGSQGSRSINDLIRRSLNTLLSKYQICHICGKSGIDEKLNDLKGYKQFTYVNDEQSHLLKSADLVISRAGATTIFELLELKKPNLLIPLPEHASRGDQVLNAKSFENQGFSIVMQENDITIEKFIEQIDYLYKNRKIYIQAMYNSKCKNSISEIVNIIKNL